MRSILNRLSWFVRDRRGTSVIEFGIVAPVFIFLTMGIADMGRGLTRKFQIEQAGYRALELISVGSINTDYTYIKAEAAAAAGVPESAVTVTYWRECAGVKQAEFDGSCPGTEERAKFVKVMISDNFVPMFSYGPFSEAFGADSAGVIPLTARSTIRVT